MEEKSRTRLKEEMQDLQRLGESIVKLPLDRINKIEMPEELRDAILLARTLKKHGAMRRQMQYVGTLMRCVNTEPIKYFIDNIKLGSKDESRAFNKLEKWRDDLVNGKEGVMDCVLNELPGVDRQHIRQLVRNAVKEKKKELSPKASRGLFKYLRELTAE